jgi:hypothetical protein
MHIIIATMMFIASSQGGACVLTKGIPQDYALISLSQILWTLHIYGCNLNSPDPVHNQV